MGRAIVSDGYWGRAGQLLAPFGQQAIFEFSKLPFKMRLAAKPFL